MAIVQNLLAGEYHHPQFTTKRCERISIYELDNTNLGISYKVPRFHIRLIFHPLQLAYLQQNTEIVTEEQCLKHKLRNCSKEKCKVHHKQKKT